MLLRSITKFALFLVLFAVVLLGFAPSAEAKCRKGAGGPGLFAAHHERQAAWHQHRADNARLCIVADHHQRMADHHNRRLDRIDARRGAAAEPLLPPVPYEKLPQSKAK